MILSGFEVREVFHRSDDISYLLGILTFLLLSALEVDEAAFQHELLPANALFDESIVQLNDIIFSI